MTTIKAVGKYMGDVLEIMCVDYNNELHFLFNKRKDLSLESEFKRILKMRNPIAGTFFSEEMSMLNVLNVIQYHFFDDKPNSVTVDGDIGEMPFEDGVVY